MPIQGSWAHADIEDEDDTNKIRPLAPISKTERMQSEKEHQYWRPEPTVIRERHPSVERVIGEERSNSAREPGSPFPKA